MKTPVAVIRFSPEARYGRSTIHISPDDAQYLPDEAVLASRIDTNLRHLEMRLERRC